MNHWTLATLREMLINIGAKVVRHAKYVRFRLPEVAVPRKNAPTAPDPRKSRKRDRRNGGRTLYNDDHSPAA